MKINWKVRFKNKAFWMALIPAVLLLASQVCAICGVQIDTAAVSDQLIGIVGTVFTIFALLGIVTDPTTQGVNDSDRAMTYQEPHK